MRIHQCSTDSNPFFGAEPLRSRLSAPGLMRRRRRGTTGVTGRRRIICRRTWRPRRKCAGRCGYARATKSPTIPTPEDWCRCSQTTPSARGRDCRCYPPTRRSTMLWKRHSCAGRMPFVLLRNSGRCEWPAVRMAKRLPCWQRIPKSATV